MPRLTVTVAVSGVMFRTWPGSSVNSVPFRLAETVRESVDVTVKV